MKDSLFVFMASLATGCCLADAVESASRKGIDSVVDIESLPFLKTEARIHFTGSMAKNGGNRTGNGVSTKTRQTRIRQTRSG